MSQDEKSPASGPGEELVDEPTGHALDPEPDPNTDWEKKAAEQLEGGGPKEGPEEDTSDDSSD